MSETEFARAERLSLEIYFLKQKVEKLEKVVEAARNLRAEVLGLNIASYEIMQAIGQTNWSVLKERSVELREALEELDGKEN